MFTARAGMGFGRRAWTSVCCLARCSCWECTAGRRRVLRRLAWLAVVGLLAVGHAAHVLPAELEGAPYRLATGASALLAPR